MRSETGNATVVGSGPNGLAAAITLAQAGLSVTVFEAATTPGGGVRSAELTREGFLHDECSTVYPMAVASPFFRTLPLEKRGVEWIHPPAPVAHPLDDSCTFIETSLQETTRQFPEDERAWSGLFRGNSEDWKELIPDILSPPLTFPAHPLLMARFGVNAIRTASSICKDFKTPSARALVAGVAGHSVMPFNRPVSAGFALVLGMLAHGPGWPMVRGGARRLTAGLVDCLEELGGKIVTGVRIKSLDELPPSDVVMLDITHSQFLRMAGEDVPASYRRSLQQFPYGPGVFKVDWALNAPVPWKNPEVSRGGTIHIGGTAGEIARSEAEVAAGRIPKEPYVLFVEPSRHDSTRSPAGGHIGWGYCHVPNGSSEDMTERIENQIERFAPGFRDTILARNTRSPRELEENNANCVGGDIAGGIHTPWRMLARPRLARNPYKTPLTGVYLCSSSTPPGGGVHGMCGHNAATLWLKS